MVKPLRCFPHAIIMRAIHNNFCTQEFLISNLVYSRWGLGQNYAKKQD
ncbi:hypothetical protein NC652_004526 [Populus alba x Populus x berolinensis]|uniref:Uncharacterized protein n=1 Tax=Populus alba x Populus x berolinensis TaxID=444605 RepID=A0AAD6RU43_9ROSI|nr:hypothetical protein NC652_004526 [Populus alba x Populus x berolinensis]KAJ7015193.1 hypothetical protein NC653_004488 [Populus alba x Populus x berolinensis]